MTPQEVLDLALDQLAWPTIPVFFRLGAAIAVAPGFGEQILSPRIKIALAVVLSIAFAPAIDMEEPHNWQNPTMLAFLASREAAIGLAIGLLTRAAIFVLQIAGAIMGQSMSLAQMFGTTADPLPVFSQFLYVTGLALFFSTGLANAWLELFVMSYSMPLADPVYLFEVLPEKLADMAGEVFRQSFILAAPFMLVSLIYYVYIGLANRTMPQLAVSFIGIPLVALIGMAAFNYIVPDLFAAWERYVHAVLTGS